MTDLSADLALAASEARASRELERFEAWEDGYSPPAGWRPKDVMFDAWLARAALAPAVPTARDLIEECRAALSEELAAWDIDPPLHHVKQAHDKCVAWLASAPANPMDEATRAVAQIAVVGRIDGHDVIRRSSALDLLMRRAAPSAKEPTCPKN